MAGCQCFGNLCAVFRQPAGRTVKAMWTSLRRKLLSRLNAWLLADDHSPTLDDFLDREFDRQQPERRVDQLLQGQIAHLAHQWAPSPTQPSPIRKSQTLEF